MPPGIALVLICGQRVPIVECNKMWKPFLFVVLVLASCKKPGTKTPNTDSYLEDTKLMLDICRKFAEEKDVKELHKTAVATQYARIITRADFNNETNLYFEFVKKVVRYSADGDVSNDERIDLRNHCEKLHVAIEEGKAKL